MLQCMSLILLMLSACTLLISLHIYPVLWSCSGNNTQPVSIHYSEEEYYAKPLFVWMPFSFSSGSTVSMILKSRAVGNEWLLSLLELNCFLQAGAAYDEEKMFRRRLILRLSQRSLPRGCTITRANSPEVTAHFTLKMSPAAKQVSTWKL